MESYLTDAILVGVKSAGVLALCFIAFGGISWGLYLCGSWIKRKLGMTESQCWSMLAVLVAAFVLYSVYDKGRSDERAGNYKAKRSELSRCSKDCSGHNAGYDWARENDVESEDDCPRTSVSFNNGCRLYVLDQIEGVASDLGD